MLDFSCRNCWQIFNFWVQHYIQLSSIQLSNILLQHNEFANLMLLTKIYGWQKKREFTAPALDTGTTGTASAGSQALSTNYYPDTVISKLPNSLAQQTCRRYITGFAGATTPMMPPRNKTTSPMSHFSIVLMATVQCMQQSHSCLIPHVPWDDVLSHDHWSNEWLCFLDTCCAE